jgi:crotonobetainyl-CoA:carnitine CoA-transferase CaiB-like acyl-CoA transferase
VKRLQGYPLNDITVIDLGQIYQGPYATFLLAMAGARVIKVEPPGGEAVRARANAARGSLPLAMLNSNKQGITLNLKTARGRELLIELAKRGDVLLENYAPGVMDRLGVGSEVLLKANPRLIYASGSGYGRSGPKRDFLAMDLTVQAIGGVMSVTGEPDGSPLKAGPAIADFLGGIHLYGGITTALYERTRTGRGRVVEVAMMEAIYPSLASNLGMHYWSEGTLTARTGNRHGGLSMAPYNVYPAKDGHVAIICVTEEHWKNLARVMGRDDLLSDPRYASHTTRAAIMDEVDALVGAWAAGRGKEEIFAIAKAHKIPAAPVRDLTEVTNDPHMHERGMLSWMDHPDLGRVVLPNSPIRFEGTTPMPLVPSPELGQHNRDVYCGWLGLSEGELATMKTDGVI